MHGVAIAEPTASKKLTDEVAGRAADIVDRDILAPQAGDASVKRAIRLEAGLVQKPLLHDQEIRKPLERAAERLQRLALGDAL